MTSGRKRLLLGIVSGVGWALCWMPLYLAPLVPVVFMLALQGLRQASSGKQAFRFGLMFGLVRMAVTCHFFGVLLTYSPGAIVFYLLAIVYFLPFTVMESWGAWLLERKCRLPRSIGFGLIYVLLEWCRTLSDVSFPGELQAHTFGTAPAWLSWTPWTGHFGFTLLIMATAVLLDQAWEKRRHLKPCLAFSAAGIVLWFAPVVTEPLLTEETAGATRSEFHVGIVQPSITVQEKHGSRDRTPLWSRMKRLTNEAAIGSDLVLWPESSRPEPIIWDERKPFNDPSMEELSSRVGVPILYGCEIARTDGRQLVALYNGAAIVYPDGRPSAWYGKQQLLPFAEGVPLADLFGYDPIKARKGKKKSLLRMIGNFSKGPEPTIFEVGEARIGVLICYEGLFPHLARKYSQEGANTLAVLTNDRWWGKTVFPYFHARMVAATARELQAPVLRAANSGISSFTGTNGRLTTATELYEVTTVKVSYRPGGHEPTFYSRYGNLTVWLVAAFIGLVIVRGLFWKRKATSP